VTVYLNYLESDGTVEGIFVRVSAPVGLFVCTEVLRHLLKFEIERQGKLVSLAQMTVHLESAQRTLDRLNHQTDQQRQEALAELEQLTHQHDTLQAHIDELMTAQCDIDQVTYRGNVTPLNAARQSQMEQRRMELLPLLDSDLTQRQLAERFDVTPQTIRRDIKALKDDGYLNDDGTRKQGSFDRLIDTIPLDQTGKDALRKSADHFTNSQKGDVS
jgi:DNA-binding transcriptional regulator YhcF (GntR family)